MNESIQYQDSNNIVASILDLATDFDRCKTWLATRDGQANSLKIVNVLTRAIYTGYSDICQLILDSGCLPNAAVMTLGAKAIAAACSSGHLSVAQLFVSRCHPSTQHLHEGLTTACAGGHLVTMAWLLNEIKLSYDERLRWMLATVCASGDIDTARFLVVHAGLTSTEAMSQALRSASYRGKVEVVDWLTTYTAADVSLRGELGVLLGSLTSLTAACNDGHTDTVKKLLKCVTPHAVNIQCGVHYDSSSPRYLF
jgi:hypothetical protein